MAGGDKNPLDDLVVPMVFGTLIGGAVSGWLNGRMKVETNKGPNISVRSRWLRAFVGGALMGYGARMARCAAHLGRRCPAALCFRLALGPLCLRSLVRMPWPILCAGCGIKILIHDLRSTR